MLWVSRFLVCLSFISIGFAFGFALGGLGGLFQNVDPALRFQGFFFFSCVFLKSLHSPLFTSASLIHFELIFVYRVRFGLGLTSRPAGLPPCAETPLLLTRRRFHLPRSPSRPILRHRIPGTSSLLSSPPGLPAVPSPAPPTPSWDMAEPRPPLLSSQPGCSLPEPSLLVHLGSREARAALAPGLRLCGPSPLTSEDVLAGPHLHPFNPARASPEPTPQPLPQLPAPSPACPRLQTAASSGPSLARPLPS